MAAQQLDALVWAVPLFNLSREVILTYPTPPVVVADSVTTSTTRSCFRMHWNTISVWEDFPAQVVQYWTTGVTQHDKQAYVITQDEYIARFQSAGSNPTANEGDVRTRLNEFMQAVHSAAANGRLHAPRPLDQHSRLQRWENGVEARQHAGIPDFVMASEVGNPRRITVVLEVKNPWQVTARLVDQVIQNVVPLRGLYPARLALEQLYGYMVRNSKQYGVLTTVKGWCFARRENGGHFYITRMFGDFQAVPGVTHGAAQEGYYVPQGFSVMQALYYLSAVAEVTPDLDEVPIGGVPGQVELPPANADRADAAPLIVQPPQPENGQQLAQGAWPGFQFPFQGVQILGGYDQAECTHYDDAFDYKSFQFLPRVPENSLGPKTWIATTLPAKSKVVLKLWDGWNFDETDRNQEAAVYLQLRSLWGKCVPSLLVKSPLEFFHALILQYIKGSALSSDNLTSRVEKDVLAAFEEIHKLNVIHGDIRPENILVAEEGQKVWIIDFEYSEIVSEGDEGRESRITAEMDAVHDVLRNIKHAALADGALARTKSQAPAGP